MTHLHILILICEKNKPMILFIYSQEAKDIVNIFQSSYNNFCSQIHPWWYWKEWFYQCQRRCCDWLSLVIIRHDCDQLSTSLMIHPLLHNHPPPSLSLKSSMWEIILDREWMTLGHASWRWRRELKLKHASWSSFQSNKKHIRSTLPR